MAKKSFDLISRRKDRPLRKHMRALFCVMTDYARKKDTIVFSENISTGGVFLETSDPLPAGTKIKLRFPLKSAYRPIQVEGKVVWSRKESIAGKEAPGMGIVFQKIKKGELEVLKEFLDHAPTSGWFL
jgi:uncharacterized protein (TIGR02266 family)